MIRPLFIFLILLLFSVGFVSVGCAATDTLTVTDSVNKTYDLTLKNVTEYTPNLTKLWVENTSYTNIQRFNVTNDGFTFTQLINFTSFTIIDGGSGTGVFSYDDLDNRLQWDFNNAILTNNVLTLEYDYPDIVNQISIVAGTAGNTGANSPIALSEGTTAIFKSSGNIYHYQAVVSNSETVTYTDTYPLSGKFVVDVEKAGYINSKVFINSTNDVYCNEAVFNSTAYSCYGTYGSGLYINLLLPSGATSGDVLINSTGTGITSPFEDNLTVGSGGAGVLWGADEYLINEVGRYYWNITQAAWDETYLFVGYQYRAEFYKRGKFVESLALGSRVGNASYPLQIDGSYIVKISKYWDGEYSLIGISSGEELATDSTIVRQEGDSWIMPPNNVGAGLPFNITFLFGYPPPLDTRYASVVAVDILTPGGYSSENYFPILDGHTSISPNTEYNLSISVREEGMYRVRLFDIEHGEAANATFQSRYIPLPVETNLSVSYISPSKSSFQYGEIMTVDYGFDSVNWSDTSYQKYLVIYNYDRETYTSYKPIVRQLETLNAELSGRDRSCYDPKSEITGCNIEDVFTTLTGNNSVALLLKNDTAEIELVHSNFTFSASDADGYGLYLSTGEVCVNDLFYVTVYAPTSATLKIMESGKLVKDYIVNASAGQVLPIRINKAGNYDINLVKSDNSYILSSLVVDNCYDTADGGPLSVTGNQRFLNLMSSNFLWVFMIFAVLMAAGGAAFGGMGVALGVGLSGVISHGMGWIGNSEMFIIVIALICVLAFGTVGKMGDSK